jgi:uncharacterized protein YbaR (Trm112 family)
VSVPEELLAIMVCPQCRGSLSEHGDALVCNDCGLHYPVRDGIPFMLEEEAYRPGEDVESEEG